MAEESPRARAARLAERKRVDEYYAKRQRERMAARNQPNQKKYPLAVNAMGQGFRNLYDALGGNQ